MKKWVEIGTVVKNDSIPRGTRKGTGKNQTGL